METSIHQQLSVGARVLYDRLLELALAIPLVWESDLKSYLGDQISSGKLRYEGFEPRQKVPREGANNFVVPMS
jgi:hypothetical protein